MAVNVWKLGFDNGVKPVCNGLIGVSCVNCVNDALLPGDALATEFGDIGTGTGVTCGKLGSGIIFDSA